MNAQPVRTNPEHGYAYSPGHRSMRRPRRRPRDLLPCDTFFETPENTQCFPDGVHAVELNVYDDIGLSDPDAPVFNIQVTTADSLALTITGSGPALPWSMPRRSPCRRAASTMSERPSGWYPLLAPPRKATRSRLLPTKAPSSPSPKKEIIAQST